MSESGLLARRAGLVALGTLASRVLGLVRDAVVAALFSIAATDAFYIAYTIPNTLRVVLGEGAVSQAFVPVFAGLRAQRGDAAARLFFARFYAALTLLLVAACALGVLLAPWFALGYAGGTHDEPQRFQLIVSLTRVLFPFLGLVALAALATGVLNVLGRFGLPAFAPALQNLAVIALAPLALLPAASRYDAIYVLAFATLLGWGFGRLLGWSNGGSLVFGLALSVASTVVLLKALQERRLVDSEKGKIAVGWLIVEDLAMVLTLVLLPAFAEAASSASADLESIVISLGVSAFLLAMIYRNYRSTAAIVVQTDEDEDLTQQDSTGGSE